ncbi:neuferricin-like [Stegodyphus dumicola]|uniref:neuferricin-like n=1 Tax=Stegodyphus dumicola TaxID=202533 RepID=UPI0015A9FD69|nr:neuferricin-like [Stegodyphus dumicola]
MGSSAITTIAIGLCLLVSAVYFSPDSSRSFSSVLSNIGIPERYLINAWSWIGLTEKSGQPKESKSSDGDDNAKLFTVEELKTYDGGPDSDGLYLAILGEVFDVEKGAQHYRPGGGYAFFTGRDASRAYITGDFTENGLTDDVSGLDGASLVGIEDWLSFYREEYKPVGKLIGRYYDQNGNPTKELLIVREKVAKHQKNKWLEDKDKEMFPPCNSEWSKEKGSRVWCTKKSGGVERNWVGVPRELHIKGKDPRCICVKNYGPPSSSSDSKTHADRGDLDHPDLKEYPGCPSASESCSVSHP